MALRDMELEGFTRPGTRLLDTYARVFLLFIAGVFALWLLGFEAIFYHPTPFYAQFDPVSSQKFMPSAVLAMAAAGYLVIRLLDRPAFPAEGSPWRAGVLMVVFAATAVAAYWRTSNGDWAAVVGAMYGLRWHAFAVLVFVVFIGWFLSAQPMLNWFGDGPGPKATRWLLLGMVLFAILFPASIAMIRGGAEGVADAYTRHEHEYIGDIGRGLTIQGLFRDYAAMHEHLSMHSKVHPPGPVVILWVLSFFTFSREALPLALATNVVGALAIVPLYAWTRDMTNRSVALTCCLVYSCIPTIVLFTATSADILFTPLTITTLFLFWRAIHRRSIAYALGAGAMYGALSLISFSLIGLGAFFGFVGLWRLAGREHRVSVIQTAALMLAAFLGLHAAVWAWSGFNIVEVFMLSKGQFDLDQANLDKFTPRYPGWLFRIINPLCWFFFAGIPVSVLFLRRLFRPAQDSSRALFIVFALTLIVLNFLYLGRGEGERSAMYIMPFLALPAAHLLHEYGQQAKSVVPLAVTLAFLAFQCWFIESFFYTYW